MMNIFQANGISKSFGEKVLFEGISMSISLGQKVALIARNGTGKTTLLNIIAGIDQPDQGLCTYKTDLRLAYLPQGPSFPPGITVSEALLTADNEQTRTIRAYEELIDDEETATDPVRQEKLQALTEQMDALGAWDYEQRIRQVLTTLKIGNLRATTGSLSGGQVKRLALARILIEDAEFILLDEPTNHLDVDMIEWLEQYLSRQKMTLLVVTHDRYFLDAVCNEILEMENGQLFTYHGDYSYYLEKKQERLAAEAAQSERATNLLRRETEWMRRTPQARTTKSKARIQGYHTLKEQAGKQQEGEAGDIKMDMARLGKKILELEHVTKSYDDLTVVRDFSYVFKKGERTGIVGPNGTGKSTLLKIITGQLQPDSGRVVTGETIRFGYYRQEGLNVDDDKKMIDVITDIAESIRIDKDTWMSAPQFLQYFNFPYHMHHTRVGKLSGGEKRRLYLLTVLINNPNFLILDEPTNDLDIHTLNLLEDFLTRFPGCLIIVSHDRYFLDRLTEHLFVFKAPGEIKDFPGNYTDFRKKQKQLEEEKKAALPKTAKPAPARKREKKKLSYKEQKEFDALEKEIEKLEEEKAELLEKMNAGTLPADELMKASTRFEELEQILDSKTNRWLELSEWV
ncbi:MAG: ABC-F family ATP-binding cassette domain-containing protein [Bacteroidales bacterium]